MSGQEPLDRDGTFEIASGPTARPGENHLSKKREKERSELGD